VVHLIVVLLLLVVGVALGYWLSRYRARTRQALARQAIYRDIRYAIDRALKAQGGDLINASQRLLDTVASRLGALTDLNRAISTSTDAISKALVGKITDPIKVEAPKPPPPAPAPVKETPPTVIINPPSCLTTVNVIEAPAAEKPAAVAEAPAQPKKPEERDMTLREQLAALRQAVETFNGAWEPRRVNAMLHAAQTALLDARPSAGGSDH
jgi:type II secretory pathway pseudopilin PulG